MTGGFYYQPKNLLGLSVADLHAYARVCRATITKAQDAIPRIEGMLSVLNDGRRKGAFLNYGGLGLAIVGIATTALLTPMGFLALAGGVMALASAEDTAGRLLQRSRLIAELEDLRRSVAFCRSEQVRISDQLRFLRMGGSGQGPKPAP